MFTKCDGAPDESGEGLHAEDWKGVFYRQSERVRVAPANKPTFWPCSAFRLAFRYCGGNSVITIPIVRPSRSHARSVA
jgi:hypothetical protein